MKLNKDKRIGRVLFIVEGEKTEFSILHRIFCNILQYNYIEKRRNQIDRFINTKDQNSTIAVINTKESNIKEITEHREYQDSLFDLLREKYDFPVEKSAIYYLFDRDPKSNTSPDFIRDLIDNLANPYVNDEEANMGQLLLSYPSIESYMISNFCDNYHLIRCNLGKEAKAFIGKNTNIQMNKLTDETLLHAANEFADFLCKESITWDIDQFGEASHIVFDMQESDYEQNKGFRLLSMLSLAFLQLGIIEICGD